MEESCVLRIMSEKLVKPSAPTPPSSRYYKVNAFDAYLWQWLVNVALFYPKGSFHGGSSARTEELFEVLETSLSKTLTYYYPFAGRFMDDDFTIDCNDAGVQLWHVQIQGSMSEILDNRKIYHPWNSVFLSEKYRCAISHVMIQFNYFDCGGICIIIYFSHKLGDAITLANFINDWAIITRGLQDVRPPTPILTGASIFPPPNGPISKSTYQKSSNLVTQRFVFSTSSISKLKENVTKEVKIKNVTQVEVVSAFIFERLNLFDSFRASSLMQMVNFRPITIPPLPEKIVGNFVGKFDVTVTEEKEMKFLRIVTELRKSKEKYLDMHKACLEGNEFMNRVIKFWIEDQKKFKDNNFDIYPFSSWTRIPFYEADFGFGKPIFVCQPVGEIERTTVLMANANEDGIEAIITLKRDQMSYFECDKVLLAFASLNPIICMQN